MNPALLGRYVGLLHYKKGIVILIKRKLFVILRFNVRVNIFQSFLDGANASWVLTITL